MGLTEILVSLFLASLIMTALMNHYIKTKQHYVHLQGAIEDDTNMQLVADFMRNSIRQAGFTPCLGIERLITIDKRDGHDHLKALEIHDQAALLINRMSPYFDTILTISNSTQLLATHTKKLHSSHPILIADCTHAEVQNVVRVIQIPAGQLVTLSQPLSFEYTPPIYIGEWLEEQFFVGASGGIFYQGHHTDELSHQVKNMSAKRLIESKGIMVHVSLRSDKTHTLNLDTMVRAQ